MGWFKRIKDGITTATEEKKELLKAYGINVQNANTLPLLKIIMEVFGYANNAIITSGSILKNISPFYLMKENLKNLMQI